MKKLFTILSLILLVYTANGQKVSTNPVFPRADQPVTITVDVTGTSLDNFAWNNTTNPVWIWTWISEGCSSGCDAPTNVDPATSPGQDAAKVTRISENPDLYQITFTPTTFFNKPADQIKKIGVKLKSRAWADNKQTDNNRIITMTDGFSVSFTQPTESTFFVNSGEEIAITGNASAGATLNLYVNGEQVATAANATSISYTHTVTETTGSGTIELTGNDGGETQQATFTYIIRTPTVQLPRPTGIIEGINYHDDPTKVTLCVIAPDKSSAYAIGDFSNWEVRDQNKMKQDGEYFWMELDNLVAGQEYAFQYLVDETIRIADPYADKILSTDDQWIPESTYPNLKDFPAAALTDKWYFDRVSVFQTNQQPYVWTTASFTRPNKRDLVIYELHIRDFADEGHRNYQMLIDTLSYFERLGVNAIQLMPIMEFSGNDSWGYNPTFMFAPDKYYGTKDKFKEFVDACHSKGIAVILDIALNHQDTPNPFLMLDFDYVNFKPNPTNPWFNVTATHPFSVFFDMNHESAYTKAYVDTICHYWLTEYKVDGYRFDLSKGFTQTNNPDNVDAWTAQDNSRIALLKRIYDKIRTYSPDSYLILEHLAANSEEKILADYGFMLWGNLNYVYSQNAMGYTSGSDISWGTHIDRGWNDANLITYMESHDEERLMVRNLVSGNSSGSYSVKNLSTALDRVKAAATFFFTVPGPKMLWQFGELGYDVSIDFNGRTGAKPIKWEYYSDPERLEVFQTFASLIKLKKEYDIFETNDITFIGESTLTKQLILKNSPYTATPTTADDMNVHVVGNFDVTNKTMTISFPHTGVWFDYFSGDELKVLSSSINVTLQPGETRLYTDVRIKELVTSAEKEEVNDLVVTPNPVGQEVRVSWTNRTVDGVRFINLHGQVVELDRVDEKLWDAERLVPGLYIVEVRNGQKVIRTKVVKK
jgi:glycosidase